ncbi:hypothetical protein WME79_17120 [Sorangium sp. So ce726]|uniref:hypothetical protein n=1 Tax=Sorangium sp. So ce726 TaxID=3133319 RepID=UPI003F6260DB
MAYVYRSVRVVLQNSTDDMLTVEGAEVLVGAWTSGLGAKNGDNLGRQSARAFATESITLQRGTEAFVRFGAVVGYLNVHWHLPWVGEFRCQAQVEGPRRVDVRVNDEEPAAIAVLVTVSPKAAAELIVIEGGARARDTEKRRSGAAE